MENMPTDPTAYLNFRSRAISNVDWLVFNESDVARLKLTVGSMFRLACVAAVALSIHTWIPRSSKTMDGNTSHYKIGFNGKRTYYSITGEEMGCRFEVSVKTVPGYGERKSYYPNGVLRDESIVYVERQTDGLKINQRRVESGRFYRPDESLCSEVVQGTGVVTTNRANGRPLQEITLGNGRVLRERAYYKNGNLAQDSQYDGEILHCTDYFPEGMPWHIWSSDNGRITESTYFDRDGHEVSTPVQFERRDYF